MNHRRLSHRGRQWFSIMVKYAWAAALSTRHKEWTVPNSPYKWLPGRIYFSEWVNEIAGKKICGVKSHETVCGKNQ